MIKVSDCCGAKIEADLRYIQYVDNGIKEHICCKCYERCKPINSRDFLEKEDKGNK